MREDLALIGCDLGDDLELLVPSCLVLRDGDDVGLLAHLTASGGDEKALRSSDKSPLPPRGSGEG